MRIIQSKPLLGLSMLVVCIALVNAQYNIEDDDPEAPRAFRKASANLRKSRGGSRGAFDASALTHSTNEVRGSGSRYVHEREFAPSHYNQAMRNYYGPTDGLEGYSNVGAGAPLSPSTAASGEFSGPVGGSDSDDDSSDADERPRNEFDDMGALGRSASSSSGIGDTDGDDGETGVDENSSPYSFAGDSNGRLNRAASQYGRSYQNNENSASGQAGFFGGDYTGLTDMWNSRPSGYRMAGSGRRAKATSELYDGYGLQSVPASASIGRRPQYSPSNDDESSDIESSSRDSTSTSDQDDD